MGNYDNLLHLEASTFQKLKDQMNLIEVPSEIIYIGKRDKWFECILAIDRPTQNMKKKNVPKKVETKTTETKTIKGE